MYDMMFYFYYAEPAWSCDFQLSLSVACLDWVISISTQTHDVLIRGLAFDASLLGPELLWEFWSLARELIRETAQNLAVHLRRSVEHDESIFIDLHHVTRAVFIALSSIHFRLFFCDSQVNAWEHSKASRVVKYTLYPLTINFLRSLRKEKKVVSRHLKRFQRSDMNTSLKTINVMLLLDMSKLYIVMSDSRDSDASSSTDRDRRHEECSNVFRIARSKKIVDRHVIF